MSESSTFTILLFLMLLLFAIFQTSHFLGFQLLTINEIVIRTQLLAGVFIGAGLGMISISEYRKGKPRTALGVALFGIGVLLTLLNLTNVFNNLDIIFLLISAGILYRIDERIRSLTA